MTKTKQALKKAETRRRILTAISRGFRRKGFAGAGVDGLAKDAGVTSGAFYAHFGSKSGAFREALNEGMTQLQETIAAYQEQHGDAWLQHFAALYMGTLRTCDLAEACALQTLAPDVGRSDDEIKAGFRGLLGQTAKTISGGLEGVEQQTADEKTWVLLALLSGGVTLARAVDDPKLAETIAGAVEKAAVALQSADSPQKT